MPATHARAGELLHVPGAARATFGDGAAVEEFLARQNGPLGRGGGGFEEFEEIYQGARPDRPPGAFLPGGLGHGALPAGLTPFLHVSALPHCLSRRI